VRLLLDTHIALWAVAEPARLPASARALIDDPENQLWYSVISLWEIGVKHATVRRGVRQMESSAHEARYWFELSGFRELQLTADHATAVDELPLHHADPFDRLLVAQALAEPLRLLTVDRQLLAYGAIVLLV
jgi:PIN domain nuclease of toxin-antitoxin system